MERVAPERMLGVRLERAEATTVAARLKWFRFSTKAANAVLFVQTPAHALPQQRANSLRA